MVQLTNLVNAAVLIFLIRLLEYTESPLLCAAIYTGYDLIIYLLFGALTHHRTVILVIIITLASFLGSYLYFRLIGSLGDTKIRWLITVIGGVILFVYS